MKTLSFKDRLTLPDYDDPGQMQMADLIFDSGKCKQCGICILLCPGGCVISDRLTKMDMWEGRSIDGKCGLPYLDSIKPEATLCVACFDCGAACPNGAISIKRNFNPGHYFQRLTQISDMKYPKRY